MSTRQKKKNPFTGLFIPVFCVAVLAYFGYHAQTGTFSIHTKKLMHEEALRLEFKLAEIRHQREVMQKRISLLTDGTIEKDQLDELARSQLGLSAENDFIILH